MRSALIGPHDGEYHVAGEVLTEVSTFGESLQVVLHHLPPVTHGSLLQALLTIA
jgi:hypothetical protein